MGCPDPSDGVGRGRSTPSVFTRGATLHYLLIYADAAILMPSLFERPIVTAPDGKFHLFDPIYKVGSLGGPTSVLHGVVSAIHAHTPTHRGMGMENERIYIYTLHAAGRGTLRLCALHVALCLATPSNICSPHAACYI